MWCLIVRAYPDRKRCSAAVTDKHERANSQRNEDTPPRSFEERRYADREEHAAVDKEKDLKRRRRGWLFYARGQASERWMAHSSLRVSSTQFMTQEIHQLVEVASMSRHIR